MKKTLISVLVICLSALGLSGCFPVAQQAAGAPQGATTGSMLAATMPMIIILLVMYLVMIVPERKRKKAAQQMRDDRRGPRPYRDQQVGHFRQRREGRQ